MIDWLVFNANFSDISAVSWCVDKKDWHLFILTIFLLRRYKSGARESVEFPASHKTPAYLFLFHCAMEKLEYCNPLIAERVIRKSHLTTLFQHPVGQSYTTAWTRLKHVHVCVLLINKCK